MNEFENKNESNNDNSVESELRVFQPNEELKKSSEKFETNKAENADMNTGMNNQGFNPNMGMNNQGFNPNMGMNNQGFNPNMGMNNQGFNPNMMNNGMNFNQNVDFEKMKAEQEKKKAENSKKRKSIGKKVVASVAAIAICGGSIGIGTSIGNKVVGKLGFSNNDNAKNFSFQEDTIVSNNEQNEDEATFLSTNNIAPIIKDVKNAVVNINMTIESRDFFNQTYESSGSGSGIIYKQDDEKIYIITNNHVVDGASAVTISITGNEKVSANLVGKDAQSDLAVISVLKTDLTKAGINEVSVATFANSDYIEVGEYVIAIGNALGEGKTVTQGIISAQNKNITIDGKKLTVLQTDAAINPGNSGGALVNTDGQVIGINTAKISSSAIEGMGYAIPSSIAISIADELMANGSIERPYLGIEGFTINAAFKQMYNINVDGVFVQAVQSNSTAEAAGLKSTDIITGLNGKNVTTVEDLSNAIGACKANEQVTIDIVRNGTQKMTINATLAAAKKKF